MFAIAGFIRTAIRVIDILEVQSPGPGGLTGTLLLQFVAAPLAGFGFLFATYYGYSRVAEGSALLFGFVGPQNFNKPHLARDLGDFWKRWHRSMADFVMQHIYLPLLVTTSRTKLALISAFVFMGLWHDFSIGFLVWGVGHGIGLAFVLPWAQRRNVNATVIRIASLVFVILLSSIAHRLWLK
jgi:D-alanyl-lipoteichoic acid acyltransferase DltB (MBOAT superfamily)